MDLGDDARVTQSPKDALARVAALAIDRPLVVFDLEATGPDRRTDRIVEIGLVRFNPGGEVSTWVRRVNPEMRIPSETTAVHGLTDADVKDSPRFAEIAQELSDLLEGADLAGYGVRSLDLPLLQREFQASGVAFTLEGRRIVDMQTIFFKNEPRDLGSAVRFFAGREHGGAHSALGDALASAEVLAGELTRYPDLPVDVEGLAEFSLPPETRFVDPERRFFWRDGEAVFNFGEFRGQRLADVAEKSPQYLDWILGRDFPHDTKRIVRDAQKGTFPKKAAVLL